MTRIYDNVSSGAKQQAREKWLMILELLDQGANFVDDRGFEDLRVIEECTYCRELDNLCSRCFLGTEKVEINDGNRFDDIFEDVVVCSAFSQNKTSVIRLFQNIMNPDNKMADDVKRKIAINLAKIFLRAIEKDLVKG